MLPVILFFLPFVVFGADLDVQTCIDNFDIHRDKIIRTQDSQNMGAKYLNEIELGSREECLRLCCETENCDVFVFEEKVCGFFFFFQTFNLECYRIRAAVTCFNAAPPRISSASSLTMSTIRALFWPSIATCPT